MFIIIDSPIYIHIERSYLGMIKLIESRSSYINKLMDDIDKALSFEDGVEDILRKHHANSDDSGDEGYFSTMSDFDINATWLDIQSMLQKKYSSGYNINSMLIRIFELNDTNTKESKDTISFWATTVFDTRNTAVAYGAKIKGSDGWSFPGNISRIQQKLGERRFYQFAKGTNKSFRTYSQLVKYIQGIDPYVDIPDEQTIIDAAYDEKYYTH